MPDPDLPVPRVEVIAEYCGFYSTCVCTSAGSAEVGKWEGRDNAELAAKQWASATG